MYNWFYNLELVDFLIFTHSDFWSLLINNASWNVHTTEQIKNNCPLYLLPQKIIFGFSAQGGWFSITNSNQKGTKGLDIRFHQNVFIGVYHIDEK